MGGSKKKCHSRLVLQDVCFIFLWSKYLQDDQCVSLQPYEDFNLISECHGFNLFTILQVVKVPEQ